AAGEEGRRVEELEIVGEADELRIERGAPEQRAVGEGNEDHPEEGQQHESADQQRPGGKEEGGGTVREKGKGFFHFSPAPAEIPPLRPPPSPALFTRGRVCIEDVARYCQE